MRVGICAVLEFESEGDMKTELPKFAKGRDYYFPEAENNARRKYIASVRHHVRDVFSYEGSLKYLFNRLPIGDHL